MIETTFGRILLACKTRLVAYLEIDTGQVGIVADADVAPFVGEKDFLLLPGRFTAGPQGFDGGRTATPFIRDIHLICRTRSYLDQADRDVVRLTDETGLGHLLWEEQGIGALHTWWPQDEDDNYLTKRGILVENGGAPTKRSDRKEFIESTIVFGCEYWFKKAREEF